MLIQENKLAHWLHNFYGYGRWDAPLWFVAHEETGGELPEDVADRINYFYDACPTAHLQLCDLREMYRNITYRTPTPNGNGPANRFEYRFGEKAVMQVVWQNLIAFSHGYNDQPCNDLTDYQRYNLANSSSGKEALLCLFPLPGPQSHAWYYRWLEMPNLPFLKSRLSYEEYLLKARIDSIIDKLRNHKPKLMLMYGMSNVNSIKKLIEERCAGEKFSMVKAIKQQIPQHHYLMTDGTTIILTTQLPALRHRRVETGFDWEALGRMAATYTRS